MEPIELVQDIVSAPAEAPKKRGRPPSKLAAAAKEASKQKVEKQAEIALAIVEEAAAPAVVEKKIELRPEMRPELRETPREEDPRTRAARRAAELRDHGGVRGDGTDEFYIDPSDVPDGWEYEWKRRTVLGQEDPAYQVQTARAGWEPVPAGRHPAFMPMGGKHATIERKGMVLMERPKEISDAARATDLRNARNQVRQKEQQLNSAPDGQFGRQKSDGSSLAKINKSYEPIPVPKD